MIVDTQVLEQWGAMVAQTIVIVSSAIGIVHRIWKKIEPHFVTLTTASTAIKLIGDKQNEMEAVVNDTILPTLESLKKEISTNGGTVSVKDRVTINEIIVNTIADGMTTAMYRCNPKGQCVWANHALCRLFGLSVQDMMHFGWTSVIEPSERDRVLAGWTAAIQNALPYDDEYTIINALSGRHIKCKTYATPIRHGAESKVAFWSGSVIVESRE